MTKTALLLGNYRATVAVARELHRLGHHVVSGLEGCDQGAEFSRAVAGIWDHPPLADRPERFLTALQRFVASRPDVQLVVPVSEEMVRFFAETEVALPLPVRIATVPAATVRACLDKATMFRLARWKEVPVAPFRFVANFAELRQAVEDLGYPLVVRPAVSTRRIDGRKSVTLASPDDMLLRLRAWPHDHDTLIVQRRVTGKRHNIYFAAVEGRICRYLHAVIDRTDRPDGSGLAVEGRTIPPLPAPREQTQALVSALNYTGIGCAQFLLDEATGATHFLEINPRIAGNHAVPEHCGLKLTELLVDLALREVPAPDRIEGRAGVRYAWTAGDLQGLKLAVLRREIGLAQALRWLARACSNALSGDLHMMFDRRDPLPGLVALADAVPLLGRITRRNRGLLQRVLGRPVLAPEPREADSSTLVNVERRA